MAPTGRLLIIAGAVLVALGLILSYGGPFLKLGHLPGDITIRRNNFFFYLPITTSILLSILLTLILYFIRK